MTMQIWFRKYLLFQFVIQLAFHYCRKYVGTGTIWYYIQNRTPKLCKGSCRSLAGCINNDKSKKKLCNVRHVIWLVRIFQLYKAMNLQCSSVIHTILSPFLYPYAKHTFRCRGNSSLDTALILLLNYTYKFNLSLYPTITHICT